MRSLASLTTYIPPASLLACLIVLQYKLVNQLTCLKFPFFSSFFSFFFFLVFLLLCTHLKLTLLYVQSESYDCSLLWLLSFCQMVHKRTSVLNVCVGMRISPDSHSFHLCQLQVDQGEKQINYRNIKIDSAWEWEGEREEKKFFLDVQTIYYRVERVNLTVQLLEWALSISKFEKGEERGPGILIPSSPSSSCFVSVTAVNDWMNGSSL